MRNKKAQSVFEYLAVFCVITVAIGSVGFIPKIKRSFNTHYNLCVDKITNNPLGAAKDVRERTAETSGAEHEADYANYSQGTQGYGEYAQDNAYKGSEKKAKANSNIGNMRSQTKDPYQNSVSANPDLNELNNQLDK